MASFSSDPWSPRQTTENTFTPSGTQTPLSPSRYSYTSQSDSQRPSSDGDDSAQNMRRIIVSPSPSRENSHSEDTYSDDNSLEEVEATLSNLDNEFDETEQALSQWTRGSSASSYTSPGRFTSSYTGSPSFTSLPTFTSRSPVLPPIDPRVRLSRITERTEESRPASGAFSAAARQVTRTPDTFRRSALLGGGTPSHSRGSTDPSSDRTLPPPGRTTELIAVFETQSPGGGHGRAASTPGFRAASPLIPPTTTTGYGYGSTSYGYGSTSYGYGSRPSSPSKSSGSSGSYTGPSLLSPPVRPSTGFRSTTPGGTRTGTGSYTTPPTYTATPSTYSNTLTQSYTNTNTFNTNTYTTGTPYTQSVTGTQSVTDTPYTGTGTFTQTSATPAGLRRPPTSPRSPLASVRNIVALWKERTPTKSGERPDVGSGSSVSPPLPDEEGLFGIRRRVQRAGQRLRETSMRDPITPTRPGEQPVVADNASIRSIRSGVLPPGIDMAEFSPYTQSEEAPLHIGLLWYLNVHASPPYRWQRCQALLYPHMLLLSWLAPGGGRGIVALDLLNCTSVQSAPSPTHPSARDDVGTVAARLQSSERDGQPLMDMLVPFHMLYADGVERLAAESLLERQKWVNRLWEAVNRPVAMPDSSSITRSPTGSIRTILSIDSRSSNSSVGSRSTVFVPPLSSLPDISDVPSSRSSYRSGLSRHSSLVSSHHTGTVDDMVIQNQEYVYPGDRRVITPQRGASLRRSGSMTDLDEEFRSALDRARGARPGLGFPSQVLGGSPVTISSGSSLGKNIFVTPPPSTGRGSDKARSDVTDEQFFSAGSAGTRSNVSSTYFSQSPSFTSYGDLRTTTGLRSDTITGVTSDTQAGPSTFSMTRGSLSDSGSYLGDSRGDSASFTAVSSSSLSRTREVRRRAGTGTRSSGFLTDGSSDKENALSGSGTGSYSSSYIPGSGTLTPGSGSYVAGSGSGSYTESGTYTPGSGSYTPGSGSYTPGSGSHTPGSGSRTLENGSYTPGSGSYTPGSGSYTPGSGSRTLESGSYTPSGSYTASGSYTPSGSYTGTGSYTPSGSYTPGSGSFTPGSGSYTLEGGSRVVGSDSVSTSSASGRTPVSSCETGYDVCPSSDFTSLEPTPFTSDTEIATPMAPSVISDAMSDVVSEKYVTASQASTEYVSASQGSAEYLTAEVLSSGASTTSFESLDSIPSLSSYKTPKSVSSYRTASEPGEPTEYVTAELCPSEVEDIPSEYVTAELCPSEVEDIPSEKSTPRLSSLSSLHLSSEPDEETKSILRVPSLVPTIRSPSIISELLPEDIPLPTSLYSSSATPTPIIPPISTLSPTPLQSTEESPDVPTPSSLRTLPDVPTPSSLHTPPDVPTPSSLHTPPDVPTPSSLHTSPDVPTPSSLRTPIITPDTRREPETEESDIDSDVSSLQPTTLPPTTIGSETSVLTPSSFVISSGSTTDGTLPPSTARVSPTATTHISSSSASTISGSADLMTFTQSSSSLALPPQRWDEESNVSYESSVLEPSPSILSMALPDGPDTSFETSILRPSGSVSSVDRLSTIPQSPVTSSSASALSPLQALTPVPRLPPSISSSSDVVTPTSLSSSVSTQSPLQSLQSMSPPHLPPSSSYSTDVMTPTSMFSSISAHSPLQSVTPVPRLSQSISSEMTPTSLFSSMSAHSPLQILTPVPRLSRSISSEMTPTSLLSPGSAHSPLRSLTPVPSLPLTPVPSLPLTVSSATDVRTPASLSSLSVSLASSSSLGRTPSTFSVSSFVSQSSLSSYIFDSRSLLEQPDFEDLGPEPSTEPSLLTTPEGSTHLPLLTPPSPPSTHLATPEGSVVVSFSTPHGSADTEKSSLETMQSESTVTERDIARDMDRLAEELRRYDDARGMEHQDIADSVRALRDELRDLSEFLRRTPSPEPVQQTTILIPQQPSVAPLPVTTTPRPQVVTPQPHTIVETPRRGVQLVDRAAGGSSVMSSLRPGGPREMDPEVSLSRATSSASSVGSFLSSHHSDDDLLEESYMDMPLSPPLWQPSIETETDISVSSTTDYLSSSPGSSSTPPLPPSSPSPSSSAASTETVRPIVSPPDILGPLSAMQEQLNALQDGQMMTNELLGTLRDRPIPEDQTEELADRLRRIEDLLRDLLGREHPRAPQVVIQQAATEPSEVAESISGSTSSEDWMQAIDHLRDILRNMGEASGHPHMPIPVVPPVGPSLSQQLDEILSAGTALPPLQIQHPPPFVPFVFDPADRSRLRSTSPISMETLPARPYTEPPLPETTFRDPRGAVRRRTVVRRAPSRPARTVPQATPVFPPQQPTEHPADEDAEHILRDQRRQRDERHQEPVTQPETFHHGRGPPPGPGHPSTQRSRTAPHDLGSGDEPRRGPSWYLPSRERPRPPPIVPPPPILQQGQPRPQVPQAQVPQAQVPQVPLPGPQQAPTYLPMPAGPTVVQMPPLFDSLMAILRENRLAQLATVDQQRELMRYMRGLNGWLERDVYDRQSELRGVIARVDQLRDDLRGMRTQAQVIVDDDSSGTPSPHVGGPPGPQMPQPQHFRPGSPSGPQMPTPHHFGGPQLPQPQHVTGLPPGFQPYTTQPVIPPVIPAEYHHTPTPTFAPVIPQMPQQQPPLIIHHQPGVPVIPMDGYRPPSRMPSVPPRHPREDPPVPFIPPLTASHSTGPPRRYQMPMQPSHPMGPSVIIHEGERSSSSAGSSSPPESRGGRRDRRYGDPSRRRPSHSESRRTPRSVSSRRSRRPRSLSYTRSSRTPSPPIVVTQVPGAGPSMIPAVMQDPRMQHAPPVHIIPPTTPGSVLSPGGPRHPELQGRLPQQQQPGTIVIQQPPQTTIPMGQPPPGVFYPPPGSAPYPPGGTGPVIIQPESPSPSRSSSDRSRSPRRRRRRSSRATPPIVAAPAAPPIIIADTRRSSSPRRYPEPYMQPPPMILPSQPVGGIPPQGVVYMDSRSTSGSSRRRRRRDSPRSDMYEPPMIIPGTPGPPPAVYPQPPVSTQPQVIVPGGMMGQAQPVFIPGGSSSRSRSPERQPVPIIVPPIQQQPTYQPHRTSSRGSRRRRTESTRTRSPPREGYPAPAPVFIPSGYSTRRGYDSPPYRYGRRRSDYSDYSPRRGRDRYSPRRDDGYRRGGRRRPARSSDYSRSPTREDDPRAARDRRTRHPEDRGSPDHPPGRRLHRAPTGTHRAGSSYQDAPDHPADHPRRAATRRTPSTDYERRPGYQHRPGSPETRRTHPTSRAPSTAYERRPGSPETRRTHPTSRAPSTDYERRPGSPESHYVPGRRPSLRSPTRVPPTSRREYVEGDDGDSSVPPVRVTVPSHRPPTVRPPTVMTLEPEEPHGVSRVPTRRGPSRAADYHMRPSTYHPDEPEYDPGDRRRPPEGVHRLSPSSGRSSPLGRRSPPTSRRPSSTSRPFYPPEESHRPPVTTEDDADRPAPPHDAGDEPIHGILRRPPTHDTAGEPIPGVVRPPSRPSRSDRVDEPIHGTLRPPGTHHTGDESIHGVRRTPRTHPSTIADDYDPSARLPPRSPDTGRYSPPRSVVHPGSVYADTDAPYVTPPDRRGAATPFDLGPADDQRERLERLDEVALRLHDAAVAAQEAEDQREAEFRHHEEERQRVFLDHEERRNEEARARGDTIWRELDSRLAALPPPASVPVISDHDDEGLTGEPLTSDRASVASIRTAAQQAASQHASDILETIRLEREEFAKEREADAAERERLVAQAEAERDRLLEARELRIKDLEDELNQVRNDLENERQQRLTEEAETRERERQENVERDEYVRNQLGDITNLVQDQRDACERKKELMEERWQEKQDRRQVKEDRWLELSVMVQRIHNDMENDRLRTAEEKEAAEARGLERMIQELQKQTAEQRELLELFSESWRADCAKHHEDTINAVRQTAQEQVPFNVQGYLDEFSKALASEVRMLLGEVGKLREERRALQHELGYLLCMKSKYGPGGEFDPEWRPPAGGPGGPGGGPGCPPHEPPGPPPGDPQQPDLPPIAKPAWRSVPKKKDKKAKKAEKQQQQQQQMPQQQHHDMMPGPSYMPDPRRQIQSWATWQPDPALHPTPPSVEPTLLVPDRGSPGLFGPRSESDTLSYQQPMGRR